MTDGTLELDPNLEQVLHDLARDPRSRLFTTAPRGALLGFLAQETRVSPHRAGLSTAEAELLTVYRSELAYLLRASFIAAFFSSPRSLRNVPPVGMPTRGQVKARAEQVAASEPVGLFPDRSTELLLGVIASGFQATPDVTSRLLVSSMLLEDIPRTRILLAKDFVAAAQPRSALRVLMPLVGQFQPPRMMLYALQTIGMVQSDLGQHSVALHTFERALRMAERDSALLEEEVCNMLNVFVVALEVGDGKRTEEMGHRVDLLLSGSDPIVERRQEMLRFAHVSSDVKERASKIRNKLGPLAGSLCDAIAVD